MTEKELKEKIKNGKVIWVVRNNEIKCLLAPLLPPFYKLNNLFATREEAEAKLREEL